MDFYSKQEKYRFYNSLAVIPLILKGKSVLIDLRNETSIAGYIYDVDGYMNITLKECVFIDQKGLQYEFDEFMITARNLRQIHIPDNIDMSIKLSKYFEELPQKRINIKKERKNQLRSNKSKKALERHKQIVKEIQQQNKNK